MMNSIKLDQLPLLPSVAHMLIPYSTHFSELFLSNRKSKNTKKLLIFYQNLELLIGNENFRRLKLLTRK